MSFDPSAYGPDVQAVFAGDRLPALDAGHPVEEHFRWLKGLTPEGLAGERKIVDRRMAQACISGLWLWCDYLDPSHKISQDIETPTGSFWHGIMHRREGDFWNSKYWFRQVGQQGVEPQLAAAAAEVAAAQPPQGKQAAAHFAKSTWDPFSFVDLCEAVQSPRAAADEPLCRAMQAREMQILFADCFAKAFGG